MGGQRVRPQRPQPGLFNASLGRDFLSLLSSLGAPKEQERREREEGEAVGGLLLFRRERKQEGRGVSGRRAFVKNLSDTQGE